MKLDWAKCVGGVWCSFQEVNLAGVNTRGVYMIWYLGKQGQAGRVVYVGQGNIADRLRSHRDNRQIQAFASHGLLVSWASVAPAHLDGVERYLADQWQPLVGDAHPNVSSIAVNAPWERSDR